MAVVLVVDDDPEWLAFSTGALGGEFSVLCATGGEDGLRMAGESRPDIIILDVLMPGGKDGFTVFCELRKNPRTRDIPVVMFSQVNEVANLDFGAEEMRRQFGKAPSAFLEKPISKEDFLAAVRKLIRARRTGPEG